MTTQNLTEARGGDASVSFAYAQAAEADQILVRFNDSNGLPLLTKSTKALGGSSDEINIVAGTGYTLKLSDEDLDVLPNSANYVLYKIVDEVPTALFGGSVTISGDKTQESSEVSAIAFDNSHNISKITDDANIKITDDFILGNSQTKNITVVLPSPVGICGKAFAFINTASANTVTVHNELLADVAVLAGGEHCAVLSDGTAWVKFS